MALESCRICGGPISSSALKCERCGSIWTPRRVRGLIVLAVVLLVLVLVAQIASR